jgi:hypothetical protein
MSIVYEQRTLGSARTRTGALAGAARLLRLYVASRRVSVAVMALAGCAVILHVALEHGWGRGGQEVPLVIVAGAATIVAVTARSPFGEIERSTGRWLACLRLGVTIALAAIALGALGAVAVGAHLPGGDLELLRNLAGLLGVGLLVASALGGGFAWVGPMAYAVLADYAISAAWTTPWIWPARPPHDLGAALCAGLVFALGVAAITVRGARDAGGE